jgi:hypothetical protein
MLIFLHHFVYARPRILFIFDGDEKVDAIQQRPGNAFLVGQNLGCRAAAGATRVTKIPARTGVHGSDEHEIGRVGTARRSARDRNLFVLKGLAQSLEESARVLGKFIEEEDTKVRQAYFTRNSAWATSDK